MKIGVYGLGRFGYFWADFLSRYFDVWGYSRNPARKTPPHVRRVSEDDLLKGDVIFFAVSISAFKEVLLHVANRISPGTVVIDTCSVKVYPAKWMKSILPVKVKIIASHPMFGPDSASNGLKGLPMILWPLRDSEYEFNYWKEFFEGTGLRVFKMNPDEHDREAAFTQGITHYLGRVIADLDLKPSPIGTIGYRKLLEIMTQTCNDPWQLFIDLQKYNPYTSDMRTKLHASIDKIMSQLDAMNPPDE